MGTVVIVTGTRGSGKSSLINQIFVSEALNQNFDIFLYSGELSPQVLKHWIDINLAGEEKIKMKNDFIRKIDPQAKQDMENWYKNRVWIYDNISNKSEDVLDRAITVTRKYGVKIWILDNLMTLNLGDEDDNYSTLKKQKEFMVNLIQYAQLYNVLIVLAIHPHKLSALQPNITADDIGGSGNLTNMAHTLLSVHRYSEKDKKGEVDGKGNYKKGKEPINADVGIAVLKNRYFGKMGTANLSFNFSDYRFFSKDEELVKRYGWNQDQSPLPKPKKRNNQPDFMNE
jgi:twinkle protein